MTTFSALNVQSLASSNQVEIETRSTADIAAEEAEEERTEFLLLLLTQLENQNPLDPLDTNEYTAQLTRYSQLEQGIETNAQLAVTNDYLQTNASNSSLSYIGEQIEVSSNTAPVQNGAASWSYEVLGSADDVILTFLDEDGNTVHEEDGSIAPGVQSVTLDAAANGLSDGVPVEIVIAARGASGDVVSVESTAYALVDGVWTDDTDTFLTSGGVSYRSDDVLKISSFANNSAANATTATN